MDWPRSLVSLLSSLVKICVTVTSDTRLSSSLQSHWSWLRTIYAGNNQESPWLTKLILLFHIVACSYRNCSKIMHIYFGAYSQFSTPETVLEGTRYMVAMQIAREPLVRHVLRQTFQERAKINIKPTKKGKKVKALRLYHVNRFVHIWNKQLWPFCQILRTH